jgi:hypothetical protein
VSITDITRSGVIDANGNGILLFQTTRNQVWACQQVSNEALTVGSTASCRLKRDGFLITPLVAQEDAADGLPYITLRPGQKLTVEWSGGVVGASIKALVVYDDGQ